MRYRAFWKDTWYECEDYGALCRCLALVGVESFTCFSVSELCYLDDDALLGAPGVIIWKHDVEN